MGQIRQPGEGRFPRWSKHRCSFRVGSGELTGAAADLGVFVPLAAALVVVNGLDAGALLISAGLLAIAAGLFFRVPFPVQPLKALTAVAVAAQVGPGVIRAAGIQIGVLLLVLSFTGLAARLPRIFTKTVVRSLQLGVGLLLIQTSAKLLTDPPQVFLGAPSQGWLLGLAVASLIGVALAAHLGRYAGILLALGAGMAATALAAQPEVPALSFTLPRIGLPAWSDFSTALFLLVIPQIPLTLGNGVVAVSGLARDYFGPRAGGVTPGRVAACAGLGNLVSAISGGMPMCHGSGGLTAHYGLGARSPGMNLVLGAAFVGTGLFFAPYALSQFGLLPLWGLCALLAYAGIRHAALAFDLKGYRLGLAVLAGLTGAVSGNLAVTTLIALAGEHGRRILPAARALPE